MDNCIVENDQQIFGARRKPEVLFRMESTTSSVASTKGLVENSSTGREIFKKIFRCSHRVLLALIFLLFAGLVATTTLYILAKNKTFPHMTIASKVSDTDRMLLFSGGD